LQVPPKQEQLNGATVNEDKSVSDALVKKEEKKKKRKKKTVNQNMHL